MGALAPARLSATQPAPSSFAASPEDSEYGLQALELNPPSEAPSPSHWIDGAAHGATFHEVHRASAAPKDFLHPDAHTHLVQAIEQNPERAAARFVFAVESRERAEKMTTDEIADRIGSLQRFLLAAAEDADRLSVSLRLAARQGDRRRVLREPYTPNRSTPTENDAVPTLSHLAKQAGRPGRRQL